MQKKLLVVTKCFTCHIAVNDFGAKKSAFCNRVFVVTLSAGSHVITWIESDIQAKRKAKLPCIVASRFSEIPR